VLDVNDIQRKMGWCVLDVTHTRHKTGVIMGMSSKLNRHLRQNELVCAGSYPHPGTKQW
jgi:hypothetical protein